MDGATGLKQPVLQISQVSKTFADKRVLDQVDLAVAPGEIVGLVGQNGSGKSTLVKILSGVYQPDPGGHLWMDGQAVDLPVPPGSAGRLGLVFVHQDLGLFAEGSLLENVRVGRYTTKRGWRIDWPQERRVCANALQRVGLDLNPEHKLARLGQVDRALVAIARAVDQAAAAKGHGLLVLDEPTSYLPKSGVDQLFSAVRELANQGMGVIFVSHRIKEVLALCSRIAVLRDGALVADLPAEVATEAKVVEAMLGRSLEKFFPEPSNRTDHQVVFSAQQVCGEGVVDASFEVARGEIVGITGLLGMGQEKVLYLLTGGQPATGTIQINGQTIALTQMNPPLAKKLDLALLPADRVNASGVQEASALENMTLATLARFTKGGRIRHRAERAQGHRLIQEFDVRPPLIARKLWAFSGGNQQKLLLARWLSARPQVLLLHEPTQGVDVGAKSQIFQLLRDATNQGVGVVIATTEYEDLVGLCDRVIVMRDGRTATELTGAALTSERLIEECYGVRTA